MTTGHPAEIPEAIRNAFDVLQSAQSLDVRALSTGLLHQTYRVVADGRGFILQRVSDVFSPEIHDNIDAVTSHLAARGLETFRLVPARDGGLYSEQAELGRWRVMTAIEGATFDRIESAAQAHSAGALVGRFHAALEDFDAPLAPLGIPFRDTPLYLARLEQAIGDHGMHPQIGEVSELSEKILAGFARLGSPPATPERVIHGDLKISNVLFESETSPGNERAVALIDLDTLMRAPLWSEWGDAWRSWCNRQGEDEGEASFDVEIFEASTRGFFVGFGHEISREERDSLLLATERICLELATRYATDLLEESYFAWDASRFASAAEHNSVRARGQVALFEAAWAARSQREAILASL